ncbi:MAG: PLDc N-terminal domain-containing protein [Candidatus Aenigmarchaeota archaeon]|nr:PLDc N-terminal domain-containing protein [Candidatus Aenigmarchaeota archaeon]
MDRLSAILLSSIILLLISPIAFARCIVNGEEIPCEQFWASYGWIFVTIGIVLIVLLTFWFFMLIDCIKRKFKDKTLWTIIIIFTNVVGAVLYYFMVKRKKSNRGI